MKSEKEIKARLLEYRKEKLLYTSCTAKSRLYYLNKKIEVLEWVLE